MEPSKSNISPIFVVILGVVSAAVVLTVYHCFVMTWCNPQRGPRRGRDSPGDVQGDAAAAGQSAEFSAAQPVPPAVEYGKDEGIVSADQTTCAVCLCDFKDGETVRLLPECLHCFHAPCVDMWLRSHTNCPMCRTEMSPMLSVMQGRTTMDTPDLERGRASAANVLWPGTTMFT